MHRRKVIVCNERKGKMVVSQNSKTDVGHEAAGLFEEFNHRFICGYGATLSRSCVCFIFVLCL